MKAKRYLPLLAAAAVAAMNGANVAVAADLGAPPPVKAPVYVPPPFSWTGFYLGGNIGGAWAQHSITDSYYGLAFDTGTSNGVFIGGGQVGFNYQAGWFVGGIEGDFDWAANNNNNNAVGIVLPVSAGGHTIAVTTHDRWISTLAARLGVAANNWLFYGKAGGGWVGNNGFTVADLTTPNSISIGSNTRSGWLAGAGIEWAVTNNWTVKLEYDYLGLGSRSFIVPAGTLLPSALVGDTFSGHRNVQEVKIGFNYLFNWGAPLAPPY